MIRYRLAQSNTWVYSIQKTTENEGLRERNALRHEAELELQAWIMKMDWTREHLEYVDTSMTYDARNRVWRIEAKWISPRMLHEIGEKT